MKIISFSLYKKIVLVTAIGASLTSCEKLKDFGTTNVNPNGSPDVLTSALLTNVEANIGAIASVDIATGLQSGIYCQYFTQSTYPGASLYTLPQINSSAFYSGSLMDCQLIINKNTDPAIKGTNNVTSGGGTENQIAVAQILQSYIFWTITDRWGNIPYSQALKGVQFLHPKYDSQEEVYVGILTTLNSAITTLNDVIPPLKGDIIYAGNNAKWRRLANSLRMLVALRLSKQYPGASEYAAQQFSSAYLDPYGFIQANTDNFTVVYPGGNYRNPWNTTNASNDNAVSKTFTDLLAGLSDTRISSMASNTNGVPYGLASAAPLVPVFAHILNSTYSADNAPLVVVGASSVWLAIAEAIERGWISGDSKTAYETGVISSFAQWGVAMPVDYLTTGPANFLSGNGVASIGGSTVAGSSAVTPSKLARIALQQYIAYYPDGTQGWSNWRRSENIVPSTGGVPDIKPTVNSRNTSGEIVRRYVYGITEYSLNPDQLRANILTMPGADDTQDTRVWWDKP